MPRKPKRYKLISAQGETYESSTPGRYAGWNGRRPNKRIFGRLDCASGARQIKPENRVFFATWDDAISAGYRPCKKCLPEP